MNRQPPRSTLFPSPPLFRSLGPFRGRGAEQDDRADQLVADLLRPGQVEPQLGPVLGWLAPGTLEVGHGPHRRWRKRSEEHTSELQSRQYLVCRLLLEKKKNA